MEVISQTKNNDEEKENLLVQLDVLSAISEELTGTQSQKIISQEYLSKKEIRERMKILGRNIEKCLNQNSNRKRPIKFRINFLNDEKLESDELGEYIDTEHKTNVQNSLKINTEIVKKDQKPSASACCLLI